MPGTGLHSALREGGVGCFWFAMGSVAVVEVAARAMPRAIVLDLQHGIWDRSGVEHAIAAIPPGVAAIARVADCSARSIGEALDAGAEGVLVPLVETAEQARAAVAFSRYPPDGIRSGGGVRPLSSGFAAYYEAARQSTVVAVMVETALGVANAHEIAATPGVDLVFIGAGDLALSVGCFPQVDSRHEDACRRILGACQTASVPCGIFTFGAGAATERVAQGYSFVVLANDIDLVRHGFAAAAAGFAEGRPQPETRNPVYT